MSWNENLKLARERYGYLQKQIAHELGISERTLQRYESGESEPTASVLIKLSKLYDTSIDSILGNEVSNNFDITKVERYLREIENTCRALRNDMRNAEDYTI